MRPIKNAAVARAFEAYPPKMRRKLMALRELIFKTAAATDGVGVIEETLKWGEPAYLTRQTKSGSTIRIGWKRSRPTQYAMYFLTDELGRHVRRRFFISQLSKASSVVFSESDVRPSTICSCVRSRAPVPPQPGARLAAAQPCVRRPARRADCW